MKPPPECILWLPSHPVQGSISMQRYWAAIRDAADALGTPVDATLATPSIPVTAAGRFRRAYEIYWAYPRRCRKMLESRGTKVAHILDHSFAHLIKAVPAGCHTVVTVHDLIPLREPGSMTVAQGNRFRDKMELLRDADRLVAVSGSTRDDLVEFLKISEERITVVPNGASVAVADSAGLGDGLAAKLADAEKPFTVLSIGLAAQRKNLRILPETFRAYQKVGGRKARLVRVGDPLPADLRASLECVLGPGSVIECGRVSDADLAAVYGFADALIFPSTYEGFGLPVLEAMAAGCPVAASAIPGHREVGGECVSYFSPVDADAAGCALAEIEGGGEELERRVDAAKARAAEFTWERHVDGLFEVYEELGFQ